MPKQDERGKRFIGGNVCREISERRQREPPASAIGLTAGKVREQGIRGPGRKSLRGKHGPSKVSAHQWGVPTPNVSVLCICTVIGSWLGARGRSVASHPGKGDSPIENEVWEEIIQLFRTPTEFWSAQFCCLVQVQLKCVPH